MFLGASIAHTGHKCREIAKVPVRLGKFPVSSRNARFWILILIIKNGVLGVCGAIGGIRALFWGKYERMSLLK